MDLHKFLDIKRGYEKRGDPRKWLVRMHNKYYECEEHKTNAVEGKASYIELLGLPTGEVEFTYKAFENDRPTWNVEIILESG